MKRIFTFALLLIIFIGLIALVSGCTPAGTVEQAEVKQIIVNDKVYNLTSVVPCDGCHAIWILYPENPDVEQPIVVNYNQQKGKYTENVTVVTIK
jgi:hypothetical protein